MGSECCKQKPYVKKIPPQHTTTEALGDRPKPENTDDIMLLQK